MTRKKETAIVIASILACLLLLGIMWGIAYHKESIRSAGIQIEAFTQEDESVIFDALRISHPEFATVKLLEYRAGFKGDSFAITVCIPKDKNEAFLEELSKEYTESAVKKQVYHLTSLEGIDTADSIAQYDNTADGYDVYAFDRANEYWYVFSGRFGGDRFQKYIDDQIKKKNYRQADTPRAVTGTGFVCRTGNIS